MAKFIIKGGKALSGEVTLAGNKNSALKLMAASLIGEGVSVLTNVPRIRDVEVMGALIKKLGAKITGIGTSTLTIDPAGINSYELDPDLSMKIRASILLTAPLLVKFGKAILIPPGGDDIGERLLDTHFSMMKKMGVAIKRENGRFILSWKEKKPQEIFLEEASVTATEMGLIMAASVSGKTVFSDVALEPHVADLVDFMGKMGVKIEGRGTTILSVLGTKELKGASHKIVSDHIEGGTFAIAAAITGGHVIINGFEP
ncbi:UDP-N-acetylglucosamine 1-carboxyvinyltransferase, partial [Candidatus Woesebacteria bacterium]|nr:UDP-N-acetylglucosamine 1-carboxyvinyltransferase [Candidatus Woesebacteria bacterium]